jgi:hypothetical protein
MTLLNREIKTYINFLFSRILLVLSQPLILFITARYLSPGDIGLYYAFTGIIASASLFEMGYGVVLTNFVNHEYSISGLRNDPSKSGEILKILAYTRKRFKNVVISFVFLSILFSICYLKVTQKFSLDKLLILCGACCTTGFSLSIYPVLCIADGQMQINKVQIIRVVQSICIGITYSIVVFLFKSLWAFLISQIFGVLILWIMVRVNFKDICREYNNSANRSLEGGLTIVKKLQKSSIQTSISWISGYISHQALAPLIMYYHGPILTGKFGLTTSFIQILVSIASLKSSILAPQTATLLRNQDSKTLTQTIRRQIGFACLMYSGLLMIAFVAVKIWISFNEQILIRFLPIKCIIIMATSGYGTIFVTFWAVWLRGFRFEPYFVHSVIGSAIGLAIVVGTGVNNDLDTYIIISVLTKLTVFVPWHYITYSKVVNKWLD